MTDLTLDRLAEIERGCEGVTPGPWFTADWHSDSGKELYFVESRYPETLGPGQASIWPDGVVKNLVASTEEGSGHTKNRLLSDAAHIANCDPDTIRELIRLAKIGLAQENGKT